MNDTQLETFLGQVVTSGEEFALHVDVLNVCYLFVAQSLSFQAKVTQTSTDKERIILSKP